MGPAEEPETSGEVPPIEQTAGEPADGTDAVDEPDAAPVSDASTDEDRRELPIILPEEVSADLDEPGIREPEPVVTETMAELYVAQGLYAEARDIYGKLLDQNPGSERIRNRLAEVVEQAAGLKAEPAHGRRERYAAAAGKGLSVGELLRQLAAGEAVEAEPAPRAAEPGPSGASAFSFDEYFGAEGGSAGEGPPGESPREQPDAGAESDESQDEDFRDWLRGLKT
jgi:hypothetical protein